MVETSAPTAEEIAGGLVPSYMPYSWLLSPFRRLVHGYGVAAYTEFEPTILFTLSFLLMFGIMFGDLGHGLILLAAGLAIKKLSRSAPARDIGHVILFAGLSSALFGTFIQGTVFGKSLEELGFRFTLGFEPISFGGESGGGGGNIMHYLLLALLVGIALMSAGMVLNVFNRLRNRDYVGGLLDHFGVVGMVFYWGILALVAKMAGLRRRGPGRLGGGRCDRGAAGADNRAPAPGGAAAAATGRSGSRARSWCSSRAPSARRRR